MATHSSALPPLCMKTDEYAQADPARRRLLPKSRFPFFASLPNLRSPSAKPLSSKHNHERKSNRGDDVAPSTSASDDSPCLVQSTDTNPIIHLDDSALAENEGYQDKYQWAILYENQRGMTIFSIPYYSSLSLLPTDPLPFTIPNASHRRSEQPDVSLEEYPLPDGTWRWVSKAWMIDMRSDTGEVQHDGFEYNWMFRKHNWRAQVGTLSAGGWVRRRRWVRLMMRPSKARPRTGLGDTPTISSSWNGIESLRHRGSIASSFPPSLITRNSELMDNFFDVDADEVWKGDNVELDWVRCHMLMKHLGRDGRKLELWKKWLGQYHLEHHQHAYEIQGEDAKWKGKQRQKQWTEDENPLPSELTAGQNEVSRGPSTTPPVEHIIAVLHIHGTSLLQSFIFPDSRAQFIDILARAGLLPELGVGLGMGWAPGEVDFWSYASGFGPLSGEETNGLDNNDSKSMRTRQG